MIKFFRKIRQNLLSEGKTGKYFKYAIGEILLVVIGILIALQINNSNEKSKEIEFAVNQLEVLSENLYKVNTNNFETYYLQLQDSVLQSLKTNNKSLYPTYFTRWYDKYPLLLANDLEYSMNENFDLVLNLERSFPTQYRQVIQTIKQTKNIYQNTKPSTDRLLQIENRNSEILSNSFDWYDDFSKKAIDKRNNYFLNDSLFQNRLFDYIQSFKMYASQANRLRMMKAKIWLEVQLLKSKNDTKYFKEVFSEMELIELSKQNCSEEFEHNKLPSFIIWNLVYNSTQDTIPISSWGNNKPTEYINPFTSKVISGRINEGIKIFKNGSCNKQYNNLINGYLIIE